MFEHFDREKILHKLNQWAKARRSIRAMLLTGSLANPDAHVDVLSDYDIVLIVDDIYPYFKDKTWIQDFGQPLVAYWDPIEKIPNSNFEQVRNVIQYVGGLKIDFNVWSVERLRQIITGVTLPPNLDSGYSILLDKDDMTVGLQSPTYTAHIPTRPSEVTFQTFVEEFFSDAPYVAKCLWRDELLPAKWCLDYDMKHNYLRPMLEWWVETHHKWSLPMGVLGKGLKQYLPSHIWSQLEGTYSRASIEESWEALFKTIALFRQVAIDVAKDLAYSYPHDLDREVSAYLRDISHLPKT